MVSFASAWEWDNIYNYDEKTKTATIENALGLGSDLATLILTSKDHEIVFTGYDRWVGGFNITPANNAIDVLQEIVITNLKDVEKTITRGNQWKKVENARSLKDKDYIDALRLNDSIEIIGKNTKYYNALEKMIIISDKDEILIQMKLISDYDKRVSPNNQTTPLANFWVEDYSNNAKWFDYTENYDMKDDYKIKNKDFIWKYKLKETEEGNYTISKINNETGLNETIIEFYNDTKNTWVEFDRWRELPHKGIEIAPFANVELREHGEIIFSIEDFEVLEYTSYLVTDLVAYYKMDESSGVIIDELGLNNATNSGGTAGVTGVINTGYFLASADDDYVNFPNNFMGSLNVGSISIWFKASDVSVENVIFSSAKTSGNDMIRIITSAGKVYVHHYNTPNDAVIGNTTITDNTWHHIIVASDGSDWYIWVDGRPETLSVHAGANSGIWFGDLAVIQSVNIAKQLVNGNSYYSGSDNSADELAIYSYKINDSTALALYEAGINNLSYPFEEEAPANTAPTLTANATSPATVYTNINWTINLTATDPEEEYIDSYVQFYVNDSKVGSEYTFNMTNNTNHLVATLGSGNFTNFANLTAEVWLGDRTVNSSKVNLTSFINATNPTVVLNSPTNDSNFTSPSVTFNITATDAVNLTNVTLYIDGSVNETNTTGINGTYIFTKAFTEGVHNWSILAYDSVGLSNQSETRSFIIDTTSPTVNLIYPTNTTYNATITQLNYSSSDIHIDKCWYSLDGGTNSSPVAQTNFSGLSSSEGINEWAVYCNDTFSNEGSDSVIFSQDTLVVTLLSPENDYITDILNNTFNCSASVDGSFLANISLWSNSTGTWQRNETIDLTSITNISPSGGWQDTSYIGSPGYSGWEVTMKEDVRLWRIDIRSSSFIGCAVLAADKTVLLSKSLGEGDYCEMNYVLEAGETYYLVGSHNSPYIPRLPKTFPLSEIPFDIIGGIASNGDSSSYLYGVENISYAYILPSKNVSMNQLISDSTLWTCEACSMSNDCDFATENRTIFLDTYSPEVLIQAPTGALSSGLVGAAETLNFTATDPGLSSCWYNYNGTNVSVDGCLTGVKNSTTFILEPSNTNLTVYANDTSGHTSSTFTEWNYTIFEIDSDYSSIVTEGTSTLISINVSIQSGLRISEANLIYDGDSTVGSVVEYNTNIYYIYTNLEVPEVTNETVKTFYWNITFENDESYTTLVKNQTVLNLNIDDCSLYSNVLFNFTVVDELTQTELNGSGDNVSVSLESHLKNPNNGEIILNFSQLYTGENPIAFCIESNLSGTIYALDAIIQYSSADRFVEFYNIEDFELTEDTLNQNITLYDLKEDDGQEFKITYKGQDFIPITDMLIQIQRKYISEGVSKVVEIPKTGSNGYAVAHLTPNDAIYNLIFIKDGVVLDSFTEVIANCQNPIITDCELNLNALITGKDLFDLIIDEDFASSLSYNKTSRDVSSTYSILSGVSDIVSLNVTLVDNFGNNTVCSDSLFSSGGTLTCTVPSNFGNATIYATLNYDGIVKRSGFISLNDLPKDQYAGVLILSSIILLLFMFGMGASDNPMISGIFLILGVFLLVGLNLVYSTSWIGVGATILWFVVAVLIIIIKGGSRR